MIQEAYVSYETSLLLDEKGFEEETTWYYNSKGVCEPFSAWVEAKPYDYSPMPTHQMACAWLREFHNIFILVGWLPIQKKYFTRIINMTDGCPKRNLHEHAGYEDAVEEALKYTLENLI